MSVRLTSLPFSFRRCPLERGRAECARLTMAVSGKVTMLPFRESAVIITLRHSGISDG
jgi:hypothetical protein